MSPAVAALQGVQVAGASRGDQEVAPPRLELHLLRRGREPPECDGQVHELVGLVVHEHHDEHHEPERIAALLRPLLGGSGVLGGPGGGGVQVPGVRHVRPPVGRPEGGGRHAELEAHVVLPAVAGDAALLQLLPHEPVRVLE